MLSVFLQPYSVVRASIDAEKAKLFEPGVWKTLDNLEGTSSNPEDWIESGNYCYEFLDSQKKYITIRDFCGILSSDGVLTIPKKIDGHKVLGVGTWPTKVNSSPKDYKHVRSKWGEKMIMEERPFIRELVLPDGLEFLGSNSFSQCSNMKKIRLPKSLVVIADGALAGATSLEEIKFPQSVYVDPAAFGYAYGGFGSASTSRDCCPLKMTLYSNSVIKFDALSYIGFPKGKKTELDIRYYKNPYYYYALQGYITKLRVDKRILDFQLEMGFAVWDTDTPPMLDFCVTELILNGKKTRLKLSKHVNDMPDEHSDVWKGGVRGLYTVKGAKSIKEARKYKVPYYWKETGKAKEVKAKKVRGGYKASWKKIRTIICEHYFRPGKGWRTNEPSKKTVYKVYGKKKKNGSYKFIRKTKKTTVKSKYRYIKAAALKTWE